MDEGEIEEKLASEQSCRASERFQTATWPGCLTTGKYSVGAVFQTQILLQRPAKTDRQTMYTVITTWLEVQHQHNSNQQVLAHLRNPSCCEVWSRIDLWKCRRFFYFSFTMIKKNERTYMNKLRQIAERHTLKTLPTQRNRSDTKYMTGVWMHQQHATTKVKKKKKFFCGCGCLLLPCA